MLFTTARYLLLLASLSTAYHEFDYIKIPRSFAQDVDRRVPKLSRRSESMLIVRNHNDLAGFLQPRAKSPPASPPRQSPTGLKAASSSPDRRKSPSGSSPRQPAASQKTSPTSSPGKHKKPDGLHHNPFFKESDRISTKRLEELFPPSKARPLELSIDKPGKRESPAGPSSSNHKKPDGLYHNPFFKESDRISSKRLEELFPPSKGRPLALSIDKPKKRPASPDHDSGESPMGPSRSRPQTQGLDSRPESSKVEASSGGTPDIDPKRQRKNE